MTESGRLFSTTLAIIVVGYSFYWYRELGPGDVGSSTRMCFVIFSFIALNLMILVTTKVIYNPDSVSIVDTLGINISSNKCLKA